MESLDFDVNIGIYSLYLSIELHSYFSMVVLDLIESKISDQIKT